jgi:GNAT superfamily N-acetyltransferase
MSSNEVSPITVRRATVGDAAAIAKAHVGAWRVAYEGIIPASYLDSLDVQQRTEQWAAILRGEVEIEGVGHPIDLVAELQGEVIGFSDFGDFRDEPSPATGELWSMYVEPDAWGNGAGRALMDSTLEELVKSKRRTAHLWVLSENARARGFYEHTGWSVDDGDGSATKKFEIDGASVEEIRYCIDL